MGLIIFFIAAIVMGFIADSKGFNPACWIFAGGLLGLIVLLAMPSAKRAKDEADQKERARSGNTAGLVVTGLAALIVFAFILKH